MSTYYGLAAQHSRTEQSLYKSVQYLSGNGSIQDSNYQSADDLVKKKHHEKDPKDKKAEKTPKIIEKGEL